MILDQGLADLVEDVHDNMSKGQSGTSTTLFLKTQSGLITAVGATNINLVDKTFTNSSLSVTHLLDVSTGNGNNLTEVEVNNGTDSYNRSVKAATSKTTAIELTTAHTFVFTVIA